MFVATTGFSTLFSCFLDPNTLTVDGKSSPEKPLIVRSIDKDKGLPKETQMAQCTVSSGDIKASAQATFSKKLEGFCSTSEFCGINDFYHVFVTSNESFLLISRGHERLERKLSWNRSKTV